jgi:transcriptional antiterminator NusG
MAKQTLNQGAVGMFYTPPRLRRKCFAKFASEDRTMDVEDQIFNVMVPTEKKIKIKNGKRKVVEEKIYPGYVLWK